MFTRALLARSSVRCCDDGLFAAIRSAAQRVDNADVDVSHDVDHSNDSDDSDDDDSDDDANVVAKSAAALREISTHLRCRDDDEHGIDDNFRDNDDGNNVDQNVNAGANVAACMLVAAEQCALFQLRGRVRILRNQGGGGLIVCV